jgi:hypothetical protein
LLARGGRQAVGERREHRAARTLFLHTFQSMLFHWLHVGRDPCRRRRFIPIAQARGLHVTFVLNPGLRAHFTPAVFLKIIVMRSRAGVYVSL